MDYPGKVKIPPRPNSSTSCNSFGNSSSPSFSLADTSGSGLVPASITNGVNGGGFPPSLSNVNMIWKLTLRFPISVSCFRCTVCQTINDLKPSKQSIQRPEPIIPLTLDRVRSIINTCQINSHGIRPPSFEMLEQEIQRTFSNWYILNESFSNGRQVTLEDCGVALDQVRETYKIMLELPVSVIRSMMKSVENILKRPGRMLKRREDIKFLMIILENPLLAQHNFPQESQYHHNIVKRIFGLLSNLSNELHHYLVNWFARLSTTIFRKRVELVNSFITFRLSKLSKQRNKTSPEDYESDWRISSAARVMALLFAANKQQIKVPLSDFYNTMVDYIELIEDFDRWEQRQGKFAFCQYPFLISMGGKMSIMEFDAKRQMESKAKEAFFTILFQRRVTTTVLILKIRRDYLIEDSLRQISANEMDLKKSLRIEFVGEDGVDGGGLRKEWFLLLVRHLFDPQFGMFTWDEDSKLCWFNPASFETSDQYYLVGVVIGLAIYNSTILDVHLPLACYKKLFNVPVGLEDLAVFRPAFARGLHQLLTFEGDVESTFCRDFVGEYEAFGELQRIPLLPDGQNLPVTNANREEYVDRYVNFVLNESIAKQFEPFKRGFNNVCGGNALSLFQPEEIELLVRGGEEPIEIEQLQVVTVYENFSEEEETIINFWSIFRDMDPLMQRKLLTFVTGTDRIPATGLTNLAFKISCIGEDSDRLINNKNFYSRIFFSSPDFNKWYKISRFPTAHTCFNQLCLYRYRSRKKLEDKLKRSITDSEGFWLK
ncbi:1132_t:CDS:10 [Funneliformis geosporum]|nr:1132_t:CDS:10 [Funneliformis geosporum]